MFILALVKQNRMTDIKTTDEQGNILCKHSNGNCHYFQPKLANDTSWRSKNGWTIYKPLEAPKQVTQQEMKEAVVNPVPEPSNEPQAVVNPVPEPTPVVKTRAKK